MLGAIWCWELATALSLRSYETVPSERKAFIASTRPCAPIQQMWHILANTDHKILLLFGDTGAFCRLFPDTCKHLRSARMTRWCNGKYESTGSWEWRAEQKQRSASVCFLWGIAGNAGKTKPVAQKNAHPINTRGRSCVKLPSFTSRGFFFVEYYTDLKASVS